VSDDERATFERHGSDVDAGKEAGRPSQVPESTARRRFLARASSGGSVGALALAYGTLTALAVRYLYPDKSDEGNWLFVSEIAAFSPGDALEFQSPDGLKAVIARRGNEGGVDDFIALSSTCPHLGCIVHWEAQKGRFFCPCHNGVFTPDGKGIGGPPGKAGQSLLRFELREKDGLLFVRMPEQQLRRSSRHAARDGHDGCLGERPSGRLVPKERLTRG